MYSRLFQIFESISINYITNSAQKIISFISQPTFTLLSIYILFWGLCHILGLIREPIIDAVKRFIKLGFILGIALSFSTYNDYVVETITKGPEEFASAFVDGYQNIGDTLQIIFDNMWNIGNKFWEQGGIFSSIGPYIFAIIIYIIACLITSYAAFLIILSKISIAILIAVGPFFIILTMFESTKRFLEQWVAQLCNYGIMTILTIAFNAFILEILYKSTEKILNEVSTSSDVVNAAPILIIGLISFLIMMQIPTISSALAGGFAIQTFGAFRGAVDRAMRYSGLNKAARYAGQKAHQAAVTGMQTGIRMIQRPFARQQTISKR